MSGASNRTTCPHCRAPLVRFKVEDAVFDHPHDLVCFNDECPYYVRGWNWMEQHFGVRVSYRYRIEAHSGYVSPIAVWSAEALRSSIIPDDAPQDGGAKEHP